MTRQLASKRGRDGEIARRCAKEIYLDLHVALNDKGVPVSLQSIRDILAREGFPTYSIHTLDQWRRKDSWVDLAKAGATTAVITYAHNARVSAEDLQAGIARNLYVYDRATDFIIRWLEAKAADPEAATFPQVMDGIVIITQCLEKIAGLRRQMLEDIMREAIDVTGPGHGGVPISPSTPAIQIALDKIRAKIEAKKA